MVAVAASLLTLPAPTSVQVSLTGMTIGQPFSVVGSTASGFTWPVPGGVATATATSAILVDNRAPLNGPVTYQLLYGGVTYTSGSVTVPFTGWKTVLQSLDGDLSVPVLVNTLDERSVGSRVVTFPVAGRRNPPTRFDSMSVETGSFDVVADETTTAALKTLLASGAPMVRRSTPGFLGINPSELIQVNGSVSHRLYAKSDLMRQWSIPFVVIDDPEPSVTAVAFDWDDFDTIYAAFTWGTWDTEWSASTWDDFDKYDWGQRL
jgi:hypothetical protein